MFEIKRRRRNQETRLTVALAGNPNVGKSTLFNGLTGLRQHTGNWTGKTVGCAEGCCTMTKEPIRVVDLPGTYSLHAHSEEEQIARDYICSGDADRIAIVCDATCLERNLILALQILAWTDQAVLCVNLMDEAKKKGIAIDASVLERRLGIPVICLSARKKQNVRRVAEVCCELNRKGGLAVPTESEALVALAEEIAKEAVTNATPYADRRDRQIDRIVSSKRWGFPIMFLGLALIFWLTMEGANLPSELLARLLFSFEGYLLEGMNALGAPLWLSGALIFGVYRTVAWVVSVMLPPMAIFFPLFTLMEDLGYLPRVAFNLDRCFCRCHACGKQALTM